MSKKHREALPDKTIKVYQREKINFQLKIAQPTWTEKQKQYLALVRESDTKIVLLKGAAGTAKTYCNVWLALELLNIGRIQEIVFIRSVVESSSVGMGFLPGDANEKLAPYTFPFIEKMKQFIPQAQIDMLIKDQRVQFLPINFLRGREFSTSFILADEIQNFNEQEIFTLLTRYAKFSKMVLCGDTEQSDLEFFVRGKSGFKALYNWFDKEVARVQGLKCFKFGIEDIQREPIIGYLIEEYQKFKEVR